VNKDIYENYKNDDDDEGISDKRRRAQNHCTVKRRETYSA